MVHSCEAITLRTYTFGEAHKLVHFFTRPFGLLKGVAYGAKASRSRFGASLEPFTHVRLVFKRKENQELAVVENCEIIRALPAYELTWEQNLHVAYLAELLGEFSREQVESETLFRLTVAVIGSIRRVPVELLTRYFEYWVLRLEGVLPALDQLLPEQLAKKALLLLRTPPEQLEAGILSRQELEQLEGAASKLIEYHLEKPLRAKKVLKDLLGS